MFSHNVSDVYKLSTFNFVGKISQRTHWSENISQPPPTTAVGKYADCLQNLYLRSKLPIKGKWPPSPCKKIIKLAAIERKDGSCNFEPAKLVRAESIDQYIYDGQ